VLYTGPVDEDLIKRVCEVADQWLELACKLRDAPHESYCLCPRCKEHKGLPGDKEQEAEPDKEQAAEAEKPPQKEEAPA
jgi:hypothetical protein